MTSPLAQRWLTDHGLFGTEHPDSDAARVERIYSVGGGRVAPQSEWMEAHRIVWANSIEELTATGK